MDNPVDHAIDLGLVNYVQHPSNSNYVVFRFKDQKRANMFEEELKTESIWYEKDTDEKRSRIYTLFGVHKKDFKRIEKINFKVEAKHKKPLIPFRLLRYTVMIIGFSVLILAVIGYCEQKKNPSLSDNDNVSINCHK